MCRNSLSQELNLKKEYLRDQYDVNENEYYVHDAIRQVELSTWIHF